MLPNSTVNPNDTTAEKPTFEGRPINCKLSFHGRLHNGFAPTCANSRTNLRKGDLFVISLNDDGTQKLVMQVDEELTGPSTSPEIRFDESIRRTFSVINFMRYDYAVHKVANKEKFQLYLVELQVKEQYLSRGDMWRFTRKLYNTAVYLKKPLDLYGMRATVYGLWVDSAPYRVSSGYITKDTKVVFRSLSTCCTIFLQMAKEMWDFDHHGDTYYEKAVDGFLFDLFTRWKSMLCQHDVTMTLFSRVFYDAKCLEDFPESLRECINEDHRGRFYEDFYQVIYQNERYDDWLPKLGKIKQVLVNYKEDLLTYHKKQLPKSEADKIPNGTISCAADGNFLETLNLSLSVFERHFIDRPFDRLGQMSLVITPGAGVFEVERELTNMTKQRVLDNGIGSDLVCLGEQPLFAVPLFKYFKKDPHAADNYQIPHWMNLSYYHSSTAPSCFKRYIPRLPFDSNRIKHGLLDSKNIMNSISEDPFIKPPHFSMEDFDSRIFRTPTKSSTKDNNQSRPIKPEQRIPRKRHITYNPERTKSVEEQEKEEDETGSVEEANGVIIVNKNLSSAYGFSDDSRRFNSNIKDDLVLSTSHAGATAYYLGKSQFHHMHNQPAHVPFCNPQSLSRAAQSADTSFFSSNLFGRAKVRPKALTNPFAPASIRIPMAPGRRRWAHTFPIGPNKIPWHFHHLRQSEEATKRRLIANITNSAHLVLPGTSKKISNRLITKRRRQHVKHQSDILAKQKYIVNHLNLDLKYESAERKNSYAEDIRLNLNQKRSVTEALAKSSGSKKEKKEAIIWGPTGVEPWSASMITGIDWKSLTIPASLPTTFDVVPSKKELEGDYAHNSYTLIHALLPQYELSTKKKTHLHNGSGNQEKIMATDNLERQRITFDELIDQRLSQGFQMIMEIPAHFKQKMSDDIRRAGFQETAYNRLLSIGRIYHTLSLVIEENRSQDTVVIFVMQYRPQYLSESKSVTYKYRFQCPDSSQYDPASHKLTLESLETFPWNTIDNVVGYHGTGDHKLCDIAKYWHIRLVLIPLLQDYTVKNIDSGLIKCDSRPEMSPADFFLFLEHFVRFLVMLNKLTRISQGSNDCICRPLDPITGKKRTDLSNRQGKNSVPIQTFQLANILSNDPTAIHNLLNLFRDDQQGLIFFKDSILPEYTFIAIEAIWWSIEHCDEIKNEQMALDLFQFLFKQGYIQHSTNIERTFRFGFFLYYIVTEKTSNFRLESNDYAEVEFYKTQSYIPSMDYLGFAEFKPMRLLPRLIDNPQTKPRPQRFPKDGTNLTSIANSNAEQQPPILLKRDCNVDVDTRHISDRHEWATAHYHAFYNPHCLFELEIRWLVATSCILGDLINNWSYRTGTMFGPNQKAFHLVPIPCDPFAEFDALRGPIHIKLNISCLYDKLLGLSEQEQTIRINIFQELVLKRFGFILNACVSYTNENIYFVHISGGMLVYILSDVFNPHFKSRSTRIVSTSAMADGQTSKLNFGFSWCWNFCLGKRWRSIHTGDERYLDTMLANFRAFCANENNRLVNFWNEFNDLANQKIAQQQEHSCNDQ